ncbi:MAG: outer membrane protein [Paraglaciecola sp.]|jgi:outer membrane protein
MNHFKIKKSLISYFPLAAIIFAGASFSSASVANDITQIIRSDTEQTGSTENYLEIGIMYAAGSGPSFGDDDGNKSETMQLINFSYNWNDLFIENYSESGTGITFGYNAFNNDNWSLDLTVTTDRWQFYFDNNGRYPAINNEKYSDPLTVGVRLTSYLGNNVVQFSVNQDATGDHNGTTISALIGRNWQVRNWNFHGIVGVEYASVKLNDYHIGVSDARAASPRFDFIEGGASAYEAGDSVSFSTELGVTYPITQDWVFRATGRVATISDEITDSPYYVTKDSVATSFRTSLSYVF